MCKKGLRLRLVTSHVEPDPEEEEYWRYEIPHTISPRNDSEDY